ncbi:PAS domain S-box protein [Acaryochloris sp. CCMEE 5410]|uniref:PAS domain-containing sensor histidine kinase n=1 Tax=Acaryochloris sp. CCMEE 5410 TaxID=310037 RepID=UPI0002484CCF|nr:PAS domain S-box protein [Acaryochloris sp. CCMEE 5410]KAI9132335.1 PAS domain S-box protein [Acaryochloris sp. CCMEE 5410]
MTSDSPLITPPPLSSSDSVNNIQKDLEVISPVVWQAGYQGKVNWLGTQWQVLTGRLPADSLGDAFWESVAEREREYSRQQWQNACDKQQAFSMSTSLCLSSGNLGSAIVQGEPLWDDQKQLVGWVGTVQVTDTATPLQSRLDYSQQFLQAVLDNLSDGIVACDAQGVLTLFNQATQALHGLPLCTIPAEQWADYYDLYEADGKSPLAQHDIPLFRALKGESVLDAEIMIKPKQGIPRTILANGDPIYAKDGQKLGAVVAMQDITQRKRAELELRKSEDRWQLAIQGTGDGLFDWDVVTNEAFMSPQLKQTLGYEDHEVENSFEGWRQLVHPHDLEDVAAALEAHLQNNGSLYRAEYRMRCRDGNIKWILARGQTQWNDDGKPIRMIGSHQDITRQKQAEQQLAQLNQDLESRVKARTAQLAAANRQKELLLTQEQAARQQAEDTKAAIELYEQIIHNIQLGFLVWKAPDLMTIEALELVAANPAAENLLETELQSKIGHRMEVVFPDFVEHNPNVLVSLLEVIEAQQSQTFDHVTLTQPSGEIRIFSLKAFPLPDHCIGVAFENITERKRTEAALSQSEQRYRTVIDSVEEVIFQTDTHGCWTFLNSAWTEITEYEISESLGKSLKKLIPAPTDQLKWQALFDDLVHEAEGLINFKIEILTKAQERRWLEIRAVPFLDMDGCIIGTKGTIHDITELEKSAANLKVQANQLIQLNADLTATTEQLEKRNQELDQFAYVTSHDLKAPLRAIANLSEWIEEDLEDHFTDEARNQMTLLRSRVMRMENLINGLLSYSRAGRLHQPSQKVDVKQLVNEIINSLNIPNSMEVQIDPELPCLMTQELPLLQVFSNLISNAVKHHNQDRGKIKIMFQDQGNHYQFSVKDDGPGIDPQYHQKVFNIFQTLKARDSFESTGIGLAIVKKIVESQGGTITLVSQLGAGSTFHFTWLK